MFGEPGREKYVERSRADTAGDLTWYNQETRLQPPQWEGFADLNKSGKSFGAISNQQQVPRATVQTIVRMVICHCHNQEETQAISCCWEKIGQDGQKSTENHQKAVLQWIRSCWNTGASVHSQACFPSPDTESLLYKREAIASETAPSGTTEVCFWLHGPI